MESTLIQLAVIVTLLPLVGSVIAGFFGNKLGTTLTHRIACTCVGVAFLIACYLFKVIALDGQPAIDATFYTWASTGLFHFDVAYLLDPLSTTMLIVVLFISFMVHVYTIGYMAGDPGYARFFSYVSLFTFAMLVLVLADNFLLLFFGWEGVGLVSYLLIGFWFTREKATFGGLKAFLVNRVGDMGFVLAAACVLMYFGTLNYHDVFRQIPESLNHVVVLFPNFSVPLITLICVLLFIGAMGKSAQVPLHVWLPESMEGPTPISALIHAATMVTAGIYMVARMSPLFEYSPTALSLILVIGGTTAFFMGLLAITQNDIKRVIAYSTLSQLGYMAVALGASAYDAAIFHLFTHAFFKALLFLAAGSVIIALHHEQDMRKMGGLSRLLPITYYTFLAGSLALCALPPFSGFYSKDIIIEAVELSTIPGAHYAYWCVLAGAFVTPIYTFRALFLTFNSKDRMDAEVRAHVHESPCVVTVPLMLLAIPSLIAGYIFVTPFLFAQNKLLGNSIFILPEHNVVAELAHEFHGPLAMAFHAPFTLTFWLSLAGILVAWIFVMAIPVWSNLLKERFSYINYILVHKYGFDDFNQLVIVRGIRNIGSLLYDVGDVRTIDGAVNGSATLMQRFSAKARKLQTGYLYHYALSMIVGLSLFLIWYVGV